MHISSLARVLSPSRLSKPQRSQPSSSQHPSLFLTAQHAPFSHAVLTFVVTFTSSSFHLESFPLPTPTNPLFAPFDYNHALSASIWSFALYSGRRSFLQTYTHTHTLTHSYTDHRNIFDFTLPQLTPPQLYNNTESQQHLTIAIVPRSTSFLVFLVGHWRLLHLEFGPADHPAPWASFFHLGLFIYAFASQWHQLLGWASPNPV